MAVLVSLSASVFRVYVYQGCTVCSKRPAFESSMLAKSDTVQLLVSSTILKAILISVCVSVEQTVKGSIWLLYCNIGFIKRANQLSISKPFHVSITTTPVLML